MPTRGWLFFYSLAATVNTVTWGVYFAFTRRYVGVELGGGLAAILLMTGLEWLYVLFAPLAGSLAERLGGKRVVLLGLSGALPMVTSTWFRDPFVLAVILSLTALAWSLTWPVVMSAVFSASRGGFGRTYSLFTIGTGFGWSIGSAIMGFVYLLGGPTVVFLFCSALYALAYSLFYSFYPAPVETNASPRSRLGVSSIKALKVVLVAYSLLVFCREAYYSVAPVKLSEEISKLLQGDPVELHYIVFGLLYGGLTSFFSVPVRLVAGALADKHNPRVLLELSLVLYVASYWLFVATEGLLPILVWQMPLFPLADTAINVILARSSVEVARARNLGVGLAFSALGGLCVLPLAALPEVDFLTVGRLLTVVGVVGLVLLAYERLARAEEPRLTPQEARFGGDPLGSGRKASREELRYRIWRLMEERNIARFPRPVYGRIPNFAGAEVAAARLAESDVFRRARVVKVNPDSPQRRVRELVLSSGKLLVMPTPRVSKGFLLLDPRRIPRWLYGDASTISGAFRLGVEVHPDELPEIDLIVAGSVVVSRFGERLGKGEGYSELEYGILVEYGKVSAEVPILTTVHDVQLVDHHIELEPWDITVDFVFTPTRTVRCEGERRRPGGILWEHLDPEKLSSIPLLRELAERSRLR